MKRRQFIGLLGGAAACPLAARGQQPAMSLVGYLHQNGRAVQEANETLPAFRRGLSQMGFVEGRNVAIEYRFAEFIPQRLPELAADLVRRRVSVIVTPGSALAARAAMAATTTIPIVMGGGADPVAAGFVASLNRPGGNVTGFVEVNTEIVSKRLELLHELIPRALRFVLLVDPDSLTVSAVASGLQAAASAIGLKVEPLVAGDDDLDAAFAKLEERKIDAVMVSPSPVYYGRRERLAALATRHRIPVIYWDRALVDAGGLMSYGSSVADMFRQVGIYAGRILKGEKPAEMPVMQATKFEFVINLKAASAIGVTIPPLLLSLADEVIE
jgi:putative tryptophan/tyrosine transport system substrate-binding protein